MNESDELEQKVKRIIADVLGSDMENLTPAANFYNDLGADSLDLVEIVLGLEVGFDIEIADDEGWQLKTVGTAVALVAAKVQAKAAGQ